MIDASFHTVRLTGSFAEGGHAYGRLCRELLTERFDAYVDDCCALNRNDRASLASQATAWATRLPAHYQEQMDAMAHGAGVPAARVHQWLFADISVPAENAAARAAPAASEALADGVGVDAARWEPGPLCSGVMVAGAGGAPWVARNCDWYLATLRRGTCAVFHRVPHRIPSLALGIMGDIDADTGMNAEGLWLHMHTLRAVDEPRAGVSCISWLFWMREALETCATLDDVERFIARTDRDRGVILFAAHGPTRQFALYECTRSTFRRVDPSPPAPGLAPALCATNHCAHKHPEGTEADPARRLPGRRSSTISRRNRLTELLRDAHPEEHPHDLMEVLADDLVEMRDPPALRTIYSAVADPARLHAWFAAGVEGGHAASRGAWREIDARW